MDKRTKKTPKKVVKKTKKIGQQIKQTVIVNLGEKRKKETDKLPTARKPKLLSGLASTMGGYALPFSDTRFIAPFAPMVAPPRQENLLLIEEDKARKERLDRLLEDYEIARTRTQQSAPITSSPTIEVQEEEQQEFLEANQQPQDDITRPSIREVEPNRLLNERPNKDLRLGDVGLKQEQTFKELFNVWGRVPSAMLELKRKEQEALGAVKPAKSKKKQTVASSSNVVELMKLPPK